MGNPLLALNEMYEFVIETYGDPSEGNNPCALKDYVGYLRTIRALSTYFNINKQLPDLSEKLIEAEEIFARCNSLKGENGCGEKVRKFSLKLGKKLKDGDKEERYIARVLATKYGDNASSLELVSN